MKLSMHILEAWFQDKEYKVRSVITEGDCSLTGARISNETNRKTVACISVKDAEYGLVSITSGQDVIFVMNSTGNDVLNIANEAFEYYNAWESSLLKSAFQGATLQDLLDEVNLTIKRPMLIKNSRQKLCAITDSYGPQVHPLWNRYLDQPLHSSAQWMDYGHPFNEPTEVATQKEPAIAFSPVYQGQFMYANLWSEGRRVGYISAYEHDRPFRKSDLQLIKVFQNILNFYISAVPSVLFSQSAIEEYMFSVLSEDSYSKYLAADIYQLCDWTPEDQFALAVIEGFADITVAALNIICENLQNQIFPVNAIVLPERIIFLINLNKYGTYRKLVDSLNSCVDQQDFVWGLSNAFTGIGDLKRQYQAALIALKDARENHFPGLTMQDSSLRLILYHLKELPAADFALHPFYSQLKTYDQENDTQYALSLFWYLYYNKNLRDAAEEMGVHRNTLSNRIVKIQESFSEENFDTINSRMLYLLSYLLDHPIP